MVGTTVSVLLDTFILLVIAMSYLATLNNGAQSVTADRDTRRSDDISKRKGVQN